MQASGTRNWQPTLGITCNSFHWESLLIERNLTRSEQPSIPLTDSPRCQPEVQCLSLTVSSFSQKAIQHHGKRRKQKLLQGPHYTSSSNWETWSVCSAPARRPKITQMFWSLAKAHPNHTPVSEGHTLSILINCKTGTEPATGSHMCYFACRRVSASVSHWSLGSYLHLSNC